MTEEKSVGFAIKLKDEVSGGARSATASLDKLRTQLNEDVKALREMRKAMRNLKGSTSVSAQAFKDLRAQIDAKKASIAASQARLIELGEAFKKTTKPSKAFLDQVAATKGPIGTFGSQIKSLKGLLASPVAGMLALAAAIVGVVVAVGAFIVATTKAAVNLLKYAVAQSDARRSEALRIEGLNTLARAQGRGTASASDMQAAIDRASDSTNRSRAELGGYGRTLARFGLRGQALAQAVEAAGIASQVQGKRGAQRFLSMARRAQLTGRSVTDVAASFRRELGPIARREMAGLDNQSKRLSENLDQIFDGVNVDGFLEGLQQIGDQFSQSTVTGRALKILVSTLFQPLIHGAASGTPLIVEMFQKAVLGGLRFAIGLKKVELFLLGVANKVLDVRDFLEGWGFDFEYIGSKLSFIYDAMKGIARLVLFPTLPGSDPGIFDGLKDRIDQGASSVVASARSLAGRVSPGIVDGLKRGIDQGASSVVASARSLAGRVSSAFSSALGIRSPSRVFAGFGRNIAAGVSGGIERGMGSAEKASSRLGDGITGAFSADLSVPKVTGSDVTRGLRSAEQVSSDAFGSGLSIPKASDDDAAPGLPADVSLPSAGSGSEGGGSLPSPSASSPVSISFGDILIESPGPDESPRDLALTFREELARVLSGVSIELGAA